MPVAKRNLFLSHLNGNTAERLIWSSLAVTAVKVIFNAAKTDFQTGFEDAKKYLNPLKIYATFTGVTCSTAMTARVYDGPENTQNSTPRTPKPFHDQNHAFHISSRRLTYLIGQGSLSYGY